MIEVYARNRDHSFLYDTVKCKTALEAVMRTIDVVESEDCKICDLSAKDDDFNITAYRYMGTWDVHIWAEGGRGLLVATVKNG